MGTESAFGCSETLDDDESSNHPQSHIYGDFLVNTKVGVYDLKYKIKILVSAHAKLLIIALLGFKEAEFKLIFLLSLKVKHLY